MNKEIYDWKPISELKPIDRDISGFGYSKKYIKAKKLDENLKLCSSNLMTGRTDYNEPVEVMVDGNTALFRKKDRSVRREIPRTFQTQFGSFRNHNNGEFFSWLEMGDGDEIDENVLEPVKLLGPDKFFLHGNFCDMFDSGDYVYAVSNLLHFSQGILDVYRIDSDLKDTCEFRTRNVLERLVYLGRSRYGLGYILIASGEYRSRKKGEPSQNKTFVFQIDKEGVFSIRNEWGFTVSPANSMVLVDDTIYFGQNKMVTKLDINTGDLSFYTNKSDEEIADLRGLYEED